MSRGGFIVLFTVLVIFDLSVIQFDLDHRWISKPLIVISLIIFYVWQMKNRWKSADTLITAALAFALGGDILLLWDDLLVYGLGSFLIMQLLYTIAFLRDNNYYGSREYLYGAVLLTILGFILSRLWSNLDGMEIPVLVYSLAISLMSWVAWTRDMRGTGYMLIWIGTMFFIISDMSIAVQTFGSMNLGKLTVMSAYALAQILIVLGFLSYRQSQA